jgi:hypothetical protein
MPDDVQGSAVRARLRVRDGAGPRVGDCRVVVVTDTPSDKSWIPETLTEAWLDYVEKVLKRQFGDTIDQYTMSELQNAFVSGAGWAAIIVKYRISSADTITNESVVLLQKQ